MDQVFWPGQLQASNPDDSKVLHLAQTLYGECGGLKGSDQSQCMDMVASAAVRGFNKRQFAGTDWDTYLYNRFDAIKNPNMASREALSGQISDEMGWKRAMQKSFGIMNGHIQPMPVDYYYKQDELQDGKPPVPYPSKLKKGPQVLDYQTYANKPDMADVQEKLQKLGYYQGNLDGVKGPMTTDAIKSFQQDNDLDVDGKYGPKTKAKLLALK